MKILKYLVVNPMTISQVAENLEVHPANITHHFRVLEKAQLIRLVEERDIGRVIERYFSAVAKSFDITPPEGSVTNANARILGFLRDDLGATIESLKPDDSDELTGLICRAKINKTHFVEFSKRLRTLIDEFGSISEAHGEQYALNVSLYPHRVDYGPLGRVQIKKKQERSKVVRISKSSKKKT